MKTTRGRGMRKADRIKFAKLVLALIGSMPKPVRHQARTGRDHEIDTPLGPLGLSVRANEDDGRTADVFGCFEYPRVAAAVLQPDDRVNPHSGKWNFHYGKGWTAEAAFADFEASLAQVMGVTWSLPDRTAPEGWQGSIRIQPGKLFS
jgi:hypothetical protein